MLDIGEAGETDEAATSGPGSGSGPGPGPGPSVPAVPTLVALTVHDDPDAWRRAGFSVEPDETCTVGAVRLHLHPAPPGGRSGIVSWSFDGLAADVADAADLDGIPTAPADPVPGPAPRHANTATSLDHVVVSSPDLERTVAVLEAAGLAARRARDTESYGQPVRQVFFRPGEAIIELVGPPEPTGTGRARFFGLAFTVTDLDAVADLLGDRLGQPKDAVQPGRRIATVRSSAGLGVPVAFMTPDAPR